MFVELFEPRQLFVELSEPKPPGVKSVGQCRGPCAQEALRVHCTEQALVHEALRSEDNLDLNNRMWAISTASSASPASCSIAMEASIWVASPMNILKNLKSSTLKVGLSALTLSVNSLSNAPRKNWVSKVLNCSALCSLELVDRGQLK